MEKYFKNLILCGEVDYFCLLCRESFSSETEVNKHLRWQNHRERLKNATYAPKFRKDLIYKISNNFYCERCNIITISPSDHIKETKHQSEKICENAKKLFTIKREENGIKINDIYMSEAQWHGVVKDFCKICCENVSNAKQEHFGQFDHIIKIIQSETICEDDQYYRKLENNKHYCFTCFETFEKSIADHIADHDEGNNNKSLEGDESPVKYIYIDHGKRRAKLKLYGRDNYIKLNEGGSIGYCSLCDVTLSAHMNVFKQHAEGSIHRGHLEFKGLIEGGQHEKPPQKLVPIKKFIECTFGPYSIGEYDVIVINDGICIEKLSWCLLKVFDGQFKFLCYGCDKVMSLFEMPLHVKTKEHNNIMNGCKVILMETGNKRECIRQIHPDLYHCASCNKVFPFWENMARHLETFKHSVQNMKKQIMSKICAHLFFNPSIHLEDLKEYHALKECEGFESNRYRL